MAVDLENFGEQQDRSAGRIELCVGRHDADLTWSNNGGCEKSAREARAR